jgi:putative oxidoreductase
MTIGPILNTVVTRIYEGSLKVEKNLTFNGHRKFPSGMSGIGLFLLRVITALALGRTGYSLLSESTAGPARASAYPHLAGALLSLVGVAMIVGFVTKVCGVVAVVGLVVALGALDLPMDALTVTAAGLSLALTLLGPGGYSVDARLFGWRRIEISRRGE